MPRSVTAALRHVPGALALRERRRHRARVAFYSRFVRGGDLVFDVGAHVGTRTAAFVEIGARVVAVEPQAECVRRLRRDFGATERVTIIAAGLAGSEGSRRLYRTDASTLASMSPEFIEAMQRSGRFAQFSWGDTEQVRTTTLDALISEHGSPSFCKIDVEGFEEQVLAGLSTPLEMLSLEFQAERPDATDRCLARLQALADYRYNLVVGESGDFALPDWIGAQELRAQLSGMRDSLLWGDVYARLPRR